MKGLYITPTDIVKYNGVAKKILSQIKALKENNIDIELCYINIEKEDIVRKIYKKNISLESYCYKKNKILKKIILNMYVYFYKKLKEYILKNNIEFVYIRYIYSGNYKFIKFLKILKRNGIKIILEIPTYPYDKELSSMGVMGRIKLLQDKYYRNQLKNYADKIVTYSEDKNIYGISCINISNGIDLEEITLINKKKKESINFISVSTCFFWHGIDRFLYSLLQYRKNGGKEKIKFHIVGEGSETPKLKKIIEENIELQDIVIFHGFKSGEELDEIYNNSDIALGSLGFHRINLEKGSTLKMREYCAKGIPFVVGYDDTSFSKDLPFYYQVFNDESLLDIEKIIEWYKNLKITPEKIRKYAEDNLTWDKQMKKIINNI